MSHRFLTQLRAVDPVLHGGRVQRILPTHLEADGPNVAVGTVCQVQAAAARSFMAEVVGIHPDRVILSPLEEIPPTFAGATVSATSLTRSVPAGPTLLGRAVDALGRAIDSKPQIQGTQRAVLQAKPPSPLERASPREILETGLRAVDGLITLAKGQRIGLFAPSGVGKTTLVAQLAQQISADVVILCLVGERGREVAALWHDSLDSKARSRATLVAATSDQSAAMRVRAAHCALALAEYWRDQGRHVLLLLDSATRLAMALRELGLAAGEPPTLRAYTPSVFAQLPKLVERCGALRTGGAISAIFTVLSETDEVDDPVSELMKSILDGHIVLSRALAEAGHFPAIDVSRSVSRQAENLVVPEQRRAARTVLAWVSLLRSSRMMIDAGLYVKGANPDLDRALERKSEIDAFLQQNEGETFADTSVRLERLAGHHAR